MDGVSQSFGGNCNAGSMPGVTFSNLTVDVGAYSNGSTFSHFNPGTLGQIGIYNGLLSANEIQSLASGLTCEGVRPDKFIAYWPLWGADSPEADYSGQKNLLSLSGTSQGGGPPISPGHSPF